MLLVFAEGDVITTVIKCAGGETIAVTHGVTLSRSYSRDNWMQGTRGIWLGDAHGMYVEGTSQTYLMNDVFDNPCLEYQWTPMEELYPRFDHPLRKRFKRNENGAHGDMDSLMLRAFAKAVRNRTVPPIEAYDSAAWMSLTALSEQLISVEGKKWMSWRVECSSFWSLNGVYDIMRRRA